MSDTTSQLPVVTSALEELQAKVQSLVAPNFCTGMLPLETSEGKLFYCKGGSSDASFLSFADGVLHDGDIQKLVEACQQATFGRGNQDVLDESYRKAWKLDTTHFAAQFDLARSGIMETVHDQLLHYEKNTLKLEPQLYKLNIYGTRVSPHIDTPRSEKLFASLVVVLPTTHTGGNLLLGKDGSLFNFDSSKLVFHPETKTPQIAFAAFYSDIEHEVLPVEAGYRITLTYNLHLADTDLPIPKALSCDTLTSLKNALLDLISNPKVLPNGGALGFGLLYQYPINPKFQKDLVKFAGALKGNDALVRTACSSIGLNVAVKVVYDLEDADGPEEDDEDREGEYLGRDWISDKVHPGGEVYDDGYSSAFKFSGAKAIRGYLGTEKQKDTLPMLWVTPESSMVPTEAAFAAYGNEHWVKHIYGNLVLTTKVPPAQKREELLRKARASLTGDAAS
ncbi:hypothetical protein EST38_g9657 [Candolleomyces aberdarensis]|uniref:Fe2OG dioxygenase domain-containing protein n=1 Tax=Candolleomyces aberdarensis TaxID=2316362 RepID=A0A4Q2DBK3_9AGAR|nr:hypothetical protein EST38_g9657 [Candolleomyces aberdarensis]